MVSRNNSVMLQLGTTQSATIGFSILFASRVETYYGFYNTTRILWYTVKWWRVARGQWWNAIRIS